MIVTEESIYILMITFDHWLHTQKEHNILIMFLIVWCDATSNVHLNRNYSHCGSDEYLNASTYFSDSWTTIIVRSAFTRTLAIIITKIHKKLDSSHHQTIRIATDGSKCRFCLHKMLGSLRMLTEISTVQVTIEGIYRNSSGESI